VAEVSIGEEKTKVKRFFAHCRRVTPARLPAPAEDLRRQTAAIEWRTLGERLVRTSQNALGRTERREGTQDDVVLPSKRSTRREPP
jgi:hypothetical protein